MRRTFDELRKEEHALKWVLIIIGIAGSRDVVPGSDDRAVTALETVPFESLRACKAAELTVRGSLTSLKTVCVKTSDGYGL